MGVSGCGKSRVGMLIAQQLALPLVEGDEYHPEANRARMRSGIPLTDADRTDWLDTLAGQLRSRPRGAVLTCSALKRSYRDRLRAAVPGLRFVWLELSAPAALARVAQRAEHFFPARLVASQFEALEAPVDEGRVLRADAMQPPETIAQAAARWVGS
jgi:gluconokinase